MKEKWNHDIGKNILKVNKRINTGLKKTINYTIKQ